MVEYDSLEEFRDPATYDVECDSFTADRPLIAQWARARGGPLLDLACGTGRMALHMAALGYSVTGVDIVSEMLARAREKAAERAVSIEWVKADARTFQLGKQFPFIFMLMNAFQFIHTRADQEALLARVREHLTPGGCFLFETRNPSPRNLDQTRYDAPRNLDQTRYDAPERYTLPDGRQLVVTAEQFYDPITQIQHYTCQREWVHPEGHAEHKTNRVALRYVYPQEMEALLHYNGLQIRTAYGSWNQDPLTAASREMIYVCQRSDS